MNKTEIVEYVSSQKSLHLYENVQDASIDVLSKLSDEQFGEVRNKLIVMAFHDGMNGQVMHFEPRENKFIVMQLYIPKNMPDDVIRWVIAHELGHVMQGRNWKDSDGLRLEDDATGFAERIGFLKTESITNWLTADNS